MELRCDGRLLVIKELEALEDFDFEKPVPCRFRFDFSSLLFTLFSVSEIFTRYYYQVALTRKAVNIKISGQLDLLINGSPSAGVAEGIGF